MGSYDKEQIYDEKISPLMLQIINICKKNKINMVASFCLNHLTEDSDDDLMCTTFLEFEDEYSNKQLRKALAVIQEGYEVVPTNFAMTVTRGEIDD